MPAGRSDNDRIGEPIPRGVVDVGHGMVGVPDQAPNFLRQISFLRSEVSKLDECFREIRAGAYAPVTNRSGRRERAAFSKTGAASTIKRLTGLGLVLLALGGLRVACGSRGAGMPNNFQRAFLRRGKEPIQA
ncbi:hypothetical protein ACO34A_28440 (plasmid) [Rhizobium sp. ACO-34A]|nr:hypothetical protein ACO34A_28440 [Rhizobium sp. ACO-34A]